MIILTDCLNRVVDEGCIKVVNSLIRLLKRKYPDTKVISYNTENELSDIHLNLNKLFLNRTLFRVLKSEKEPVVYMPQSANTTGGIIRTWVISRMMRSNVTAMFADCGSMNWLDRFLLKTSGVKVITLSRDACNRYQGILGSERVLYLKVGVDLQRFVPVDSEMKAALRKKYNVPDGMSVLLHVGHLTRGRNISQMCKVDPAWYVILVVSTHTAAYRDETLRKELLQRPFTMIIDTFVANIEELYQVADVYFFPVVEKGNCIAAPLSVFEAAACNTPVVTTNYGNLEDFVGEHGFCYLESFDSTEVNEKINKMIQLENIDNRSAVIGYDWNIAVQEMINYVSK